MRTCRIFLLIGIAVFIGYIQAGTPVFNCSENEESICGPSCIETCSYKPEFCTKECKLGCFCKKGYVRQSNGTGSPCVIRENCSKIKNVRRCCKNQEYATCGSACPPTCSDFSYPLPKPPKFCIELCVAGCFCKQGFYRSGRNRCVAPENCCNGQNEHYTSCGTTCPETCDYKPVVCTKQCVQGCFCESSDYVRKDNSTNSPCIPRKECPKKKLY